MSITFKCFTKIPLKKGNIKNNKISRLDFFLLYLNVYIKTIKKAGKYAWAIGFRAKHSPWLSNVYIFHSSVNQLILPKNNAWLSLVTIITKPLLKKGDLNDPFHKQKRSSKRFVPHKQRKR